MKINVVWVAIAIVAGFVLGGWGLRTDLRKVKEELRLLQKKTEKSTTKSAELQGIRSMLRLPENKGANPEPRTERARRHSHSDTNPITEAQRPSTGSLASASSTNNAAAIHKSISENIKQASELWKTRVALARNSFVSNTSLNKQQEDRFDVLLEAMNLRLGDSIQKWAEYMKTKGDMNPEDGVRMMKDLSEAIVITYDELDRNMPPDWRNKSGENFQLFDFIDPEVAMPLTEIEGMLGKGRPPDMGQVQNVPQGQGKPGVKFKINTK